MGKLSEFCTCRDKNCPLHPQNHDKGCAPCIAKNLKTREMPNCFFELTDPRDRRDGYSFEDFARTVLRTPEEGDDLQG